MADEKGHARRLRLTRQLPQRSLRSLATAGLMEGSNDEELGPAWTYGFAPSVAYAPSVATPYVGNRLTLCANHRDVYLSRFVGVIAVSKRSRDGFFVSHKCRRLKICETGYSRMNRINDKISWSLSDR
jgi:hypothetical protein